MKRARILVVEDERITAHDIQATLQSLGHEVPAISASGHDAVAKVDALRPDLVLLDIRLKGSMDGVTVAEEIRRRHQIPVIYLTANADPETVERATRTEAYGYLLKPFSEQELHTTVQLALYKAEAERALAEREAWFRKLVEKSSDITMVLDAEASVRFASPPVERVLGYLPEDLLGRNAMEMIHPDDRARMEEAFAYVLARAEECVSTECRSRHRSGAWRVLEAQATNYLADPVIQGVVVNTRDITERKEAEAVIRAAKETAERASQAKSELLSRTSHELRTPLNAILGFGQLLDMSELPPAQCESVEQILSAGRHLLALVDEVLDLSTIEAGRLHLSLSEVRVSEVLRQSLNLVRDFAAQQRVFIDVGDSLRSPYAVWTDARRLQQVMFHLISNAIKYNRENGSVTVWCGETANGRIRIEVRDTGPGIVLHELERLFTPFNRMGAERSQVEGAGLGLALSKALMQALGGEIGAESTPGEGSTFWIELPQPDPTPRLEVDAGDSGLLAGAAASAPLVLYIEDNAANMRLVDRIFRRSRPRLKLITATQGRDGLELARQRHPDLILLDFNLPDISGEEVLRALREEAGTRQTPVVIISGDASPEHIRKMRQQGVVDYITKPFEITRFLQAVDDALTEGARKGVAARDRAPDPAEVTPRIVLGPPDGGQLG